MISPIVRRLVLFVLANALLVNFLLFAGSGVERHVTVWNSLIRAAVYGGSLDSWGPMRVALDRLRTHPDEDLYTGVLEINKKFQYPPSSLLSFVAVQKTERFLHLPDDTNSDRTMTKVVGWIFVALNAWFVGRILLAGMKAAGRQRREVGGRWDHPVLWATVAVATLTFYPVIKAHSVGQIQVWINATFAALVWFRMNDRKTGAGVLTGLICLVKPHYGLLLLWGALRREWRFLATGATVLALGLAASLWAFGVRSHLDYLAFLSFISRRGEAYYPNQSVNGLLNRIWSIRSPELYNNLTFLHDSFPPFNPTVFYPTVISSAVLILAALFLVRHRSVRGTTLDLVIMALSITVASPIAWEHHYGVLLPIYAGLAPALLWDAGHPWNLAWLGVSYLLTSNYLEFVKTLAYTPFNPVQSYLLAGALLVLFLLYRVQGRLSPAEETMPPFHETGRPALPPL